MFGAKLVALLMVISMMSVLPDVSLAQAVPPHIFQGTAFVNGVPASDGTVITALVGAEEAGSTVVGNDDGSYSLLVAQGEGTVIIFKVGTLFANETALWVQGDFDNLDLTAHSIAGQAHFFVGEAFIDGVPASEGTLVTAFIGGEEHGSSTVLGTGEYGSLRVTQGPDTVVTFKIGALDADQTAVWTASAVDLLDLTATSIGSDCTLEITPTHTAGTLTVEILMGTSLPATINLWGTAQSDMIPIKTGQSIPITDPPITKSIIRDVPSKGVIGLLATMTNPESGIICSDFKTVDTG